MFESSASPRNVFRKLSGRTAQRGQRRGGPQEVRRALLAATSASRSSRTSSTASSPPSAEVLKPSSDPDVHFDRPQELTSLMGRSTTSFPPASRQPRPDDGRPPGRGQDDGPPPSSGVPPEARPQAMLIAAHDPPRPSSSFKTSVAEQLPSTSGQRPPRQICERGIAQGRRGELRRRHPRHPGAPARRPRHMIELKDIHQKVKPTQTFRRRSTA